MSEAEGSEAAAEAPAPAAAEGAEAEALSEAAAAVPEAPAPAEAEEEIDLDNEAADDVFADPAKARALAEKYRKEAAKRRVEAKEAKATFEGWTEADAKVLSEVIQLAAADPKVGAAKMREIAALLDGGDVEGAAAVAAEASEAAGEKAAALTPEDVDKKVQEALAAADQKRAVETKRDEILARTKELGYEVGTPDYFTIIHIAQNETGGDLEKAHEVMEARNQAIIDRYVEGVRERAAGTPLHARRGEDSVMEPTSDIKTFKDAREHMEARLVALTQGDQK